MDELRRPIVNQPSAEIGIVLQKVIKYCMIVWFTAQGLENITHYKQVITDYKDKRPLDLLAKLRTGTFNYTEAHNTETK